MTFDASARCRSARPLVRAMLLALAALPAVAMAEDLLTVWQAAAQHDRALNVARAEHAAGQALREQAAALWRPTVSLGLGAGLGAQHTRMEGAHFSAPGMGAANGVDFGLDVHSGLATRAALEARQPIFNRSRDAARAQLELGAEMTDSIWREARQQQVLRTADGYFNLALADERVRLGERHAEAVARSRTEAHERFELGDVPVTDTHEADAALASVRARLEAARLQQALARQALADGTGLAAPRAQLPGQMAAAAGSLQDWLDAAMAQNLRVRLAEQGVALAEHEARKRRAASGVTVDLVGQASFDRVGGTGGHAATSRSHGSLVSVQVNIPIYDGGMAGAQASEGARRIEKAHAQLELAREQVAEQVRASWLGWQAGEARLLALQDGLKASAARLDATRVGRAVGDRTLMDVFQAENDHAAAALGLAEACVGQVLNRLRLAALADRLDDGVMAEANASLMSDKPVASGAAEDRGATRPRASVSPTASRTRRGAQ